MRSLKRSLLAIASVLTFAIFARGHAPPGQYDTFTAQQTFIHDPHTHLTWQRAVDPTQTDQQTAAGHCANSGQRLPTYRELLTIVDEDPHDEWDPTLQKATPRYIDPDAFPGTPAGPFWTMSPGADKSQWKVVNFGTGMTSDLNSVLTHYRCVSDDN
jgi:hypothetical protein